VKRKRPSAFSEALRILGRRDHFLEELRRKLVKKNYETDEITSALKRCTESGFLDDQGLALRFAADRASRRGWSPARIQMELRKRGAGEEIVRNAVSSDRDLEGVALARALEKIQARAPIGWWRTGAGRARLLSSLLRRGFEPGEARRALDAVAAERCRDEEDEQPGNPE